MQILDTIGVQRWRLRQSTKSTGSPPAAEGSPPAAEGSPPAAEGSPPAAEGSPPAAEGSPPAAVEGKLVSVPEVAENPDANTNAKAELDWQGLASLLGQANQCHRCAQSTPILGNGDVNAEWVFVIDAPSLRDIDQQKLLSGRAGQLFEGILAALDLHRDQVYLSSVFKCPAGDEIQNTAQCDKVIHQQIRLIQPRVVFTFGEVAAQMIIKANEGLAVLRSRPQHCFSNDLPIVPSHSLHEVLRNPVLKAELWADLKIARSHLAG